MIFLKLYRLFVGKVKLSADGEFAERILNICAQNGITAWGIRKRGSIITFYILASDFKRLHSVRRKSGVSLHILKKRGLPFLLRRYRKRYGLVVGLILFFVILEFMSGFVWNIDVTGNKKVSSERIIAACAEMGIKEGTRISDINAWERRVELLTRVDGLAWAAINIEGCKLTVDVTEAKVGTPAIADTPCNLKSSGNGIVKKIEVTTGVIMVSVGDVVTDGSLLVSGIVENPVTGSLRLVHASGKVIAEVSETLTATVPFEQKITYTGKKTATRYALDFFGFRMPLYIGDVGRECRCVRSCLRLEKNSSYMPVFLHKAEFYPIHHEQLTISLDTALETAKNSIEKQLKGKEILSRNDTVSENSDSLTVTSEIIALKNIATEDILLFNGTNP